MICLSLELPLFLCIWNFHLLWSWHNHKIDRNPLVDSVFSVIVFRGCKIVRLASLLFHTCKPTKTFWFHFHFFYHLSIEHSSFYCLGKVDSTPGLLWNTTFTIHWRADKSQYLPGRFFAMIAGVRSVELINLPALVKFVNWASIQRIMNWNSCWMSLTICICTWHFFLLETPILHSSLFQLLTSLVMKNKSISVNLSLHQGLALSHRIMGK